MSVKSFDLWSSWEENTCNSECIIEECYEKVERDGKCLVDIDLKENSAKKLMMLLGFPFRSCILCKHLVVWTPLGYYKLYEKEMERRREDYAIIKEVKKNLIFVSKGKDEK